MPTNILYSPQPQELMKPFPKVSVPIFLLKSLSKNQMGHDPKMAVTEETSDHLIQHHFSPPQHLTG